MARDETIAKMRLSHDSHRVYKDVMTIDGANPATFEETVYRQGKDKNGTYSSGYRTTDKN